MLGAFSLSVAEPVQLLNASVLPKELAMRHLTWIAILVAFTQLGPAAYAQSDG